MSKQWERN